MNHSEIIAQLKTIEFNELRTDKPEHFEMVFDIEHLSDINKILESFFGKALKTAGDKPSSDAKKYSENYGGIEKQQTLYFTGRDGHSYLAMLWPWGDGESITLKFFVK